MENIPEYGEYFHYALSEYENYGREYEVFFFLQKSLYTVLYTLVILQIAQPKIGICSILLPRGPRIFHQVLNRLCFGKPIDHITNFWHDTRRRSIHLHIFNQESVVRQLKGK